MPRDPSTYPDPTPVRQPGLEPARTLARLLDSAIRVPGTDFRVGLDPVLGLVPGLGDVVGGALSGYLLLAASRLGAPRSVLLRMLGNIAIDSTLGAVPVLGDLFDAGFKSNVRNLALLEHYVQAPRETSRSSTAFVVLLLVLLALLVAGVIAVGALAARALWTLVGG